MTGRNRSTAAGIVAALVVSVSLSAPPFVSAAPILDQEYDASGSATGFTLDSAVTWAQTFTVGIEGMLTHAAVQVGLFGPASGYTGPLDFAITATGGGLPTTVLASGSILASTLPAFGAPTFTTLQFPDLAVQVGDVLAIVLSTTSSVEYGWRAGPPTYLNGAPFFNVGGGFVVPTFITDLGFQTFVDPATVPEPATLLFFATAAAALAGRRRLLRRPN